MPKSSLRGKPTTWRIRPSPSCSWRRSLSPTSARSSRPAAGVRRPTRWYGRRISPSSKAKVPATCSSRPIARAFSGAGKPFARRPPLPKAGRSPIPSGAVLDPIFSLRRHVRIPRGATARVAFWTLAASSREDVLDLADKHHDPMAFDRAKTLAWTQAQMQLAPSGHRHGRGASVPASRQSYPLFGSDPAAGPPTCSSAARARRQRSGRREFPAICPSCWCGSRRTDDLELVRQLLRAHEYWRLKQLAVDLVILNERAASYVQDLQNSLDALVRMNQSMPRIPGDDPRGAVFVLRADLVSPEIRGLLSACARAVLHGNRGSLADQIKRARDLNPAGAPSAQARRRRPRRPKRRCRVPRWSSSTGSAGSRMTAANI